MKKHSKTKFNKVKKIFNELNYSNKSEDELCKEFSDLIINYS